MKTDGGVKKDYNKAMEYYNKFGDYVAEYKKGARQGKSGSSKLVEKSRHLLGTPTNPTAGPSAGPNPKRGGYQQQMKQEQSERNRKAAGKLLPELMKMRNSMIEGLNK